MTLVVFAHVADFSLPDIAILYWASTCNVTSALNSLRFPWTGWKFKLPTMSRFYYPGLGGSIYFHPVQDIFYPGMVGSLNFYPFQDFIFVKYHRQVGSLNFWPVQGFIFVNYHRLGGSIYFQPVCDILKNKTLHRSEVYINIIKVSDIEEIQYC